MPAPAPERRPSSPQPKGWGTGFLVFLILIVAFEVLLSATLHTSAPPAPVRIPYSPTFLTQVEHGNLSSISTKGTSIQGNFRAPVQYPDASATPNTRFMTEVPEFANSNQLMAQLQKEAVVVNAKAPSTGSSVLVTMLLTFGPVLLFVAMLVWLIRRSAGVGGGMAAFGLAGTAGRARPAGCELRRRRRHRRGQGGADRDRRLPARPGQVPAARRQDPTRSAAHRAARNRQDAAGAGPRGRGSGPVLLDLRLGVRGDVRGRRRLPCLRSVPAGQGGRTGDRLHRRARCDRTFARGRARRVQRRPRRARADPQPDSHRDGGFDPSVGVIMISATNRPEVLDPALLRPGRFDRRVAVQPPDTLGRRKILEVHTRSVPLAEGVDLDRLAATTPGMVGADLANVVNEAALLAARRGHAAVTTGDLHDALEKLVLGSERRILLSPEERERTAYHEAGHAIVGMLTPGADPVRKVSIIPRGIALGVTLSAPEADRFSYDRPYLVGKIKVALGGRVAEELVYDEVTTGAQNDIKQATELARNMVGVWGMSDLIGPVTVISDEGQLPIPGASDISPQTQQLVDEEVRHLIEQAHEQVTQLMSAHRDQLDSLAAALLEHETLEQDEAYAAAGIPMSGEEALCATRT